MPPRLAALRLVAITDPALPAAELVTRARALAAACPPGALLMQVRDKAAEGAALVTLVRALVAAVRPHGALLVVNDRLDVALAAGADGVHLPEAGMPLADARAIAGATRLVGTSRHSAAGAAEAARAGADLVQLGPIWATPSKAAYGAPLGPAELTAARARLDAARSDACLVAVGGIDAARAQLAREAGAHAVAAIRAVWADAGLALM
jgi:thiamine-phosphate pyrophosphorylase